MGFKLEGDTLMVNRALPSIFEHTRACHPKPLLAIRQHSPSPCVTVSSDIEQERVLARRLIDGNQR